MDGQVTLGEALKADGMYRAEIAAGDWKKNYRQAIALLAATGEEFTSDSIRELCGDPWDHPNAVGSLFNEAARNGLIRRVGYRKSERPSLHMHPTAVWVGTP